MLKKLFVPRILATLLAALLAPMLFAQSGVDTGNLRGNVVDGKGKSLPGAIVRAKGPQGAKATETDSSGNYNLPFLTPGTYELTVTMDGYSTQVQSGIAVAAKQTGTLSFKLTEGTETVIVRSTIGVDVSSSASTTKVNLAEAINNFAVSRSFSAAFDFAPGAITNSGVGGGNPSIGGASGLENQYIIGGINVTSSGYGSLGAYSQLEGAVSTEGVTSEFLQDLDIIEGGQDAQYGGALGGVINATVKSGSNDWHGAISTFYDPRGLQGGMYVEPYHHLNSYGPWDRGRDLLSVAVQLGGPIIKDKLFFFVGINPVWTKQEYRLEVDPADIAMNGNPLPNANIEYDNGNNRTDTLVGRLDWVISEKHRVNLTFIGFPQQHEGVIRTFTYGERVDPTQLYNIPTQPTWPSPDGVPVTGPTQGASGTFKISDKALGFKYYGSFTPNFNVELGVSYHQSHVHERPNGTVDQPGNSNILRYTDIRYLQAWNSSITNKSNTGFDPIVAPTVYQFGGIGAYQNFTNDVNATYTLRFINNFNFWGAHELKWGGEYADLKFSEDINYSGGTPTAYLNEIGGAGSGGPPDPDSYTVIRTGASATVRCYGTDPYATTFNPTAFPLTGQCPQADFGGARTQYRYRITGGSFSPVPKDTRNKELNFFVQDNWSIGHVVLNLGVRWTREEISNPQTFQMTSTGDPITGAGKGNPLVAADFGGTGHWVGTRTLDCVNNGLYTADCYVKGPGWFVGQGYRFQGEFSPRIGVAWDVFGNGKSKLYAKVARLYERVPNDLAVRSFGNSFDVSAIYYNDPTTTQQSVDRIPYTSGSTPTRVQPGTRLPYKDDFSLGYEFTVGPSFKIDVKANYRTQGRILEDTQAASTEAILNMYYTSYFHFIPGVQRGCLSGCTPGQEQPYPGQPSAPFGEYVLANLNENSPSSFLNYYPYGAALAGLCPASLPACDGLPTGTSTNVNFGHAVSKYRSLSITAQKQPQEGQHFGMQASYRYAILSGNYEGLFRNDNGQSDPNITSLFDFPNTHLTESQYYLGHLNLDVPHSLKVYTFYRDFLLKNLTASLSFHWESGRLRTPLIAHPFYGNSGEMPGTNPSYFQLSTTPARITDITLLKDYTPVYRGSMGRTPDTALWDLGFDYKMPVKKSSLDFSLLVENIFNDVHNSQFDDNIEYSTGILNPDNGLPIAHLKPRTFRFGLRWSF
jgi:hypothetical protein